MHRSHSVPRLVTTALLLALGCLSALGSSTKFWTTANFDDFARGNFSGVSLSREGAVTLAPKMEEVFQTDQAIVWAVAQDRQGNTYLGTGHSGKVFRLAPDMSTSLVFDAPELNVFALAVDAQGTLYAGTSPDGKVYRIGAAGEAEEFFDPESKYIWSMAFPEDGMLYVGTGDRGKIFRVAPDGAGEVFYETQQSNVMSLAVLPGGDLIAGTDPNGLVYRLAATGKATVLYDAPLAEIHSLAIAGDGAIYASAMGASERRRQGTPGTRTPGEQAPVRGATTSITVRAATDAEISPVQGPGQGEEQPQPGQQEGRGEQQAGGTTAASRPASTRVRDSRTGGSALFRIDPDGAAEPVWSSSRESVFGLLPAGGNLLFSTDANGRIYELSPDRLVSLVTETGQEETTRLISRGDTLLAMTANLGKVFSLGTEPAATGSFESEIQNAGNVADWGQIRWRAEMAPETSLRLFTRSGNSSRPDATWSEWSSAYENAAGEKISSPPARYMQWKADFRSAQGRSPVLSEVTLAYLPRNRSPLISELKVTPRGTNAAASGLTGGAAGAVLGQSSARRGLARYATAGNRTEQKGIDVSWLVTDPDQDELAYALYFRGTSEAEWKLLEDGLSQNYFQMDNETLPDGYYRLKVVATDAGANPAQVSKTAEKISSPFLVDGTSPLVEVEQTARSGGSARILLRASDRGSVLTRAEYTLDAEPPVPLFSQDGIVDSTEETFAVQLDTVGAGEHLVTLRVYDSAGNMGVGKALLPPSGTEK